MQYPNLIGVQPLDDYQLALKYDNGENRLFDVKPYIRGSWYGELQDVNFFRGVRVVWDTVEWPNGQDMAPHVLYETSIPMKEVEPCAESTSDC